MKLNRYMQLKQVSLEILRALEYNGNEFGLNCNLTIK